MTRAAAWNAALRIARRTKGDAVVLWGYPRTRESDADDSAGRMTYFAVPAANLIDYPNDTVIDSTED